MTRLIEMLRMILSDAIFRRSRGRMTRSMALRGGGDYPSARPMGSAGPGHLPGVALGLAVLIPLYGCASRRDSPEIDRGAGEGRVAASDGGAVASTLPPGPPATVIDARPAALVNGRPIRWGDLRPLLCEAAGGQVLQEYILDEKLADAIARAELTISTDDEKAEEQRLLAHLDRDPAVALKLLDELRDAQGLGPERYRSLLRRNAMLRALVTERVEVTDAAVTQMYDAVYGPKRRVRLLTLPDLSSTQDALALLRGGAWFGDVAVERSTDSSAARGGLLEPISRSDPSYPSALREAIWALPELGAISDPTLLDTGYAIVQLEEEHAGGGKALDDVREELVALVERSQERLLMERRARAMILDANVTIFDESLHDAWRRRRKE